MKLITLCLMFVAFEFGCMDSYRSVMRTSIATQISTSILTLLTATLAISLTLMTASLLLWFRARLREQA